VGKKGGTVKVFHGRFGGGPRSREAAVNRKDFWKMGYESDGQKPKFL